MNIFLMNEKIISFNFLITILNEFLMLYSLINKRDTKSVNVASDNLSEKRNREMQRLVRKT